jgi:hypothetical protein
MLAIASLGRNGGKVESRSVDLLRRGRRSPAATPTRNVRLYGCIYDIFSLFREGLRPNSLIVGRVKLLRNQVAGENMIKKLILASTLLWSLPANALTITNDGGGLIPMYVAKMQRAAAIGERVIIDGNCLSACTMTLGIIPPQNVCATPRAVLGFHSAFTPTPWG